MSVRLDGDIVYLEGRCPVEDAEPLLAWLQADGDRMIDIGGAEHLHAAIVQVLMALQPSVRGMSQDPFLRRWIAQVLKAQNIPEHASREG